jgi:CxxC motif-containing protein (DUF1111 family)
MWAWNVRSAQVNVSANRANATPGLTAALSLTAALALATLGGCHREAPVVAAAVPVAKPAAAVAPVTPAAATFPVGFDFNALRGRVDWRAHVLASGQKDAAAQASIARGQALFTRIYTPETGLGPFYNNTSCISCHNQGGLPGHGTTEVVTHLWADKYPGDDSDDSKNPRLMPRYTLPGHAAFPMPTTFVHAGDRLPPQLMGLGWIEAVPGEQIVAQPHVDKPEPGQHTTPLGWVPVKAEAPRGTLRFGLKPGVATVDEFIIGALQNELGVTTPNRAFDKDDDAVADPEMSISDIVDLANFVALSESPARPLPAEFAPGLTHFKTVGCAACHWSAFTVESQPAPQFYSDLMVHDMGQKLSDVHQIETSPSVYSRTTPLWSLHLNEGPYLHDGRAKTLEEAVLAHEGEATQARAAFVALAPDAKQSLLTTLKNL